MGLLAVVSPIAAFAADDQWTLTTADLRSQPAAVASIDSAGVHLAGGEGAPASIVPLDRFVQLDRGGATAEAANDNRLTLHLVTGDRVAGAPVGLKNDAIVWKNPILGEIAIPLTQVAALSKVGPPSAGPRTEDVATLANGDAVRGIVSGVTGDAVSIKLAGGDEAPVPLASLSSVVFATAPGQNAATKEGFRVRLEDGSAIVGKSISLQGQTIQLSLDKSASLSLGVGKVVAIEHVNGPVSWLTSRAPKSDVHLPFIGAAPARSPTHFGADAVGEPFYIGGRPYSRGIGVHSYSRLVYALDGQYAAFQTRYGLNDSLTRGDVTVRVLLDGKVAHEAAHVRPGRLSPLIVVKLGAAKELALEVDYGDGLHTQDRLNWIEPALVKEMPAATSQPSTQPSVAK